MPVLKSESAPTIEVKKGLKRKLIYTGDLMTAVLDFSNGPWDAPEPPHSHPHAQTTYIVSGEIIFYCEGEPDMHLGPGDMFYVPGGKEHTIKLLTPTARLVDNFSPIREDFL